MAKKKRPSRPHSRGLTPKQQAFVNHRIAHPTASATASARAAGYSDPGPESTYVRKAAHEVVTNGNVQAALSTAQQRAARAAELDAAYVLDGLRRTVDQRLDAPEAPQATVAQRGLELIGKHLGMFEQRLRVTVDSPLSAQTWTLAELEAMASQMERQALPPGTPETGAGEA